MLFSIRHGDHPLRPLMVVVLVVTALLVASVAYAALAHRSTSRESTPVTSEQGVPQSSAAAPDSGDTDLSRPRATSDAEAFARSVAEALFTWDTSTPFTRADHVEQLIAVADPTGESTLGLASDLDDYLPSQEAWVDLAQYETRQWLAIDSVVTPSVWAEAEAQAGDELLPGTTAYTVEGTRHRSGVWEEEPASSEHDVAFTIFIVCAPSSSKCHLLRLSMLDKPLD